MNEKQIEAFESSLIKEGYIVVGDLDVEGVKKLHDKILRATASGRDFVLAIDSCGGLWEPTMRLIEKLEVLGIKGIGVVTGVCRSMAIPLFLACKKRIATPNAAFLFHEIGGTVKYRSGETLRSLLARTRRDHAKTLQTQREYIRHCAQRMGIRIEVVEKLIEDGEARGRELRATSAKRLGIVHEVTSRQIIDVKRLIVECLKE